jgi:hypothetical protein
MSRDGFWNLDLGTWRGGGRGTWILELGSWISGRGAGGVGLRLWPRHEVTRSPRPAKRGEGGERSEPGEGRCRVQGTVRPLTPAPLPARRRRRGTSGHGRGERGRTRLRFAKVGRTRLLSPRPAKRGEGGERSEPGEGRCHVPRPRACTDRHLPRLTLTPSPRPSPLDPRSLPPRHSSSPPPSRP